MKEYRNKAFVLLALFLILTFESEGKPSISKGQIAEPAFNHQGDLIYIYNNTEEKISLETLKFQTKESFSLTIPLGEKSRSPIIKKDRKGQIWVVWEEWEADRSSIFLGQLKENKIIHSQLIYEAEGINICPDLSFDSNDNPGIVWINYKGRQYKVFVRESISRNIWLINFPLLSSAFNPQIITDLQDHVWVFWSGRDNKNEEIYYRVFNQYDWTPLNTINLQSNFPQINPTITLDGKGFIWLAWSGYDGKDYEIYCKFWNGKEWSKIIGITDNSKKDDSFPCISIVSDDIPIIAWTQSGGEGSQVCIKYSENNSWSEEIKISPKRGQNIFPKIVVERERIGIIWLSQNEIESELILFHQLKEKKPPDESFFKIHIIYNPSLNEDKYIGFGDSITYGYIYYEEAPEKGYIPRLEILLDQNFGDTEVVNEGWPGEITQNGLARIDKVIGNHMARYLLLMEGTNDVVFKRISMDTTAFNLEQMVKKCIDFGLFPALATIIPRNDWRWHREFFRDRIFYLKEGNIKSIKHKFQPTLSYTLRPYQKKDDYRPWFEEVDTYGRLNSVSLSLDNYFDARRQDEKGRSTYSQSANFILTQGYDIDEATEENAPGEKREPFSPLNASLSLTPYPALSLTASGTWNHYKEYISSGIVGLDLTVKRSGGRQDSYSIDYVFARDSTRNLNYELTMNLLYGFSVGAQARRDLNMKHDIENSYWIDYQSQCWGFRLIYEDLDEDTRAMLFFSLLGIGKVATFEVEEEKKVD